MSRRAVVTGGAGGIGAAIAELLAARGDDVLIADLDEARLEETGRRIGVEFLATDVASASGIDSLISYADQTLGGIDLYVANAGIFSGFGLEASEPEWAASWDVNVMAHVRAAQALLPRWLEAGSGQFAVTASAAGLLTQLGSPTYSVTKHAAVGFAEWLAATYGDRGIQVTCLCPMGVQTPMIEGSQSTSEGPDSVLGRRAVTTAGDVLSPEYVATVLLDAIDEERFLALPHADVARMFAQKAQDHDRWLSGMQWFRNSLSHT